MKILFILPYDWGGMPHYVAEIANAVSHHAEVIVIGSQAIREDYFSKTVTIMKIFDGFHLQSSYVKGLFSLTSLKALSSFRKIDIISDIDPDVIHIATPLIPPLSFFIWKYGLDKKYPIVYTKHGIISDASLSGKLFEEYILNFFEKLISLKQVIVHTHNDKSELIKRTAIPEDTIVVIPHGTYSFFQRFQKENTVDDTNTKNTILFFGRIKEYKGLSYLLHAIPIIFTKIPDLKVIIAGEGDLSPYQAQMEACNKSVFEIHNEFVPDDLVASLFQRSTLVVLPYSEMSGMSGVLNVAYAFGKPVVVSDVGGLDEAVESGKTGLLVPPKDSQALADSIIRLLTDSYLRAEMEKNVLQKAEELSWDTIAKKTIEVYKEVCISNCKNSTSGYLEI